MEILLLTLVIALFGGYQLFGGENFLLALLAYVVGVWLATQTGGNIMGGLFIMLFVDVATTRTARTWRRKHF